MIKINELNKTIERMTKSANFIMTSLADKGVFVTFGITESDEPQWGLEILRGDEDLVYWRDFTHIEDLEKEISEIEIGVRLAKGDEI